jgi:hypothetical protein
MEIVQSIGNKFRETAQIKQLNTFIVESKETEEETFAEIAPLIKKLF